MNFSEIQCAKLSTEQYFGKKNAIFIYLMTLNHQKNVLFTVFVITMIKKKQCRNAALPDK